MHSCASTSKAGSLTAAQIVWPPTPRESSVTCQLPELSMSTMCDSTPSGEDVYRVVPAARRAGERDGADVARGSVGGRGDCHDSRIAGICGEGPSLGRH